MMRGESIYHYISSSVSGSLNAISPLVSNLYMVVYGVINIACFMASHYSSPGICNSLMLFFTMEQLYQAGFLYLSV